MTFEICYDNIYLEVQKQEQNIEKGSEKMSNIVFKRDKLKGRIIEKFGSQKNFAIAVHLTQSALSQRLNNVTDLTNKEIQLWASLLDIEDINSYFFEN